MLLIVALERFDLTARKLVLTRCSARSLVLQASLLIVSMQSLGAVLALGFALSRTVALALASGVSMLLVVMRVFFADLTRSLVRLARVALMSSFDICVLAFVVLLSPVLMRPLDAVQSLKFVLLLSLVQSLAFGALPSLDAT